MAGQIQLTFLFVIIACVVLGAPCTKKQGFSEPLLFDDDVEIRANIDKTVDALLPSIRKIILTHGMDPMKLPDFSEPIFSDLPGIFKGNIDLKKGWMQNLSLVKRTEHVTAIYKDKRLTLDMNLGFDVMDFNYAYYLKYLLYKREGDIYGRLYKLDVNVVVTIDLNEYNLHLDSIKFSNVWTYDIKFEGNLLDRILSAVTKVITTIFRNTILTVIEDHAKTIFGMVIDEWNTMIPRPNRTEIINEWFEIVKIPVIIF